MRITSLERVEKLLNLEQVTIWVTEHTVVDVERGVDGWGLLHLDVALGEMSIPFIDAARDHGQDYVWVLLAGLDGL